MPASGQRSDVGIAGLCAAGRDLALRLAARGLRISLWDFAPETTEEFVVAQQATRGGLVGYSDMEDFAESLGSPRRIVVFESAEGRFAVQLRSLLQECDRLLEWPVSDEGVSADDLDQLELTLIFQLD